jgi:hypothetical protein
LNVNGHRKLFDIREPRPTWLDQHPDPHDPDLRPTQLREERSPRGIAPLHAVVEHHNVADSFHDRSTNIGRRVVPDKGLRDPMP